MTLRQLLIAFYAHVVTFWDAHALVASEIHNLNQTVGSIFSKSQPKYRTAADFHPFRTKQSKPEGIRINAGNFDLLQLVADRLISG